MMGISFVKDAIDVRSTIDTIRFPLTEGDLLALGEDETDYYSSYSTHGMGMSLPIMLAKLFNADLKFTVKILSRNGRPRCFSGVLYLKLYLQGFEKRKITNKIPSYPSRWKLIVRLLLVLHSPPRNATRIQK